RAMACLRDRELDLIVVGAADATSVDLGAIAASAGVSHRVRVIDWIDDAELRVLYAAATVFCFPSLDEGFALCPLEAMAAGMPTAGARLLCSHQGDASERSRSHYTTRQLLTVSRHRVLQGLRAVPLLLRISGVPGPVLRGLRVIVEHAYALSSVPGLILEDGVL